ncbi:MAG TPA: coenzyme F420-0:L-glutamate ligase [Oscillospiraceae bacterium]|nr:coenzyme F420-0:L-glutamate ligase [Oscillospiraceae bacterium]
MSRLPDYIGPLAFGVKIGVVVPKIDLVKMITAALAEVARDELLDDGDVICVTESVVARAQNNFVTVTEIAEEVRRKLKVSKAGKIAIVFPITSRNRFSLILQGVAAAVPQGEVVVQLSYPSDEVGNQVITQELAEELTAEKDYIMYEDLQEEDCLHPITKVNYLTLYKKIIEGQGAKATIFLSNNPQHITKFNPDGVIVADVHGREATSKKLSKVYSNFITLQDLCREGESWSEWGLLGSNMSANDQLKLAPRESSVFVRELQAAIKETTGRKVEVLVYGDGAYKDPSTGIYELADPKPVFGMTDGLAGRYREGIKYKYVADVCYAAGKSVEEIEAQLAAQKQEAYQHNDILTEGTTPRRVEDVIASLADLVSGSADAGTPVVVVKGIL